MAIFHANTKTINRSSGHSATAKVAYICGKQVTDIRTGEIHDYTRKGGVVTSSIVLPQEINLPELSSDILWNMAEKAEKRKDGRVGREWEISLPHELNNEQRKNLANELSQMIADKYGVACEYAIHEPSREGIDKRNHHVHILTTTRKINNDGNLTDKSDIELDRKQCAQKQIKTSQEQIIEIREQVANTINQHLQQAGIQEQVSHLSLEAQGIDRVPQIHQGKSATEIDRRDEFSILVEVNQEIKKENIQIIEIKQQIMTDGDELAKINAELYSIELEKIELKKISDELVRKINEENEIKLLQKSDYSVRGQYKNPLFNIAKEYGDFFTQHKKGNYCYYTSRNENITIHPDMVNIKNINNKDLHTLIDVAMIKFGNELTLFGNDIFIKSTIVIIAENEKYDNIILKNETHQKILDDIREKEQIRKNELQYSSLLKEDTQQQNPQKEVSFKMNGATLEKEVSNPQHNVIKSIETVENNTVFEKARQHLTKLNTEEKGNKQEITEAKTLDSFERARQHLAKVKEIKDTNNIDKTTLQQEQNQKKIDEIEKQERERRLQELLQLRQSLKDEEKQKEIKQHKYEYSR